jgi:hypothetical protein
MAFAYWEDKFTEGIEELRRQLGADAELEFWENHASILVDGSAEITRKISAINLAVGRRYFEYSSWNDPEATPADIDALKASRTMTVTCREQRQGQSLETTYDNVQLPPDDARKLNRIIHLIPLSRPGAQSTLSINDEFQIDVKEKVEVGTFKLDDYFEHQVRHPTRKLRFEVLLPPTWNLPSRARPPLFEGVTKTGTYGEWVRHSGQPTWEQKDGRVRIRWEISHPKLLSTYSLRWHLAP